MSSPSDPGPAPVQGVTARALRSGAWLYGRQTVMAVVGLGTTAILARSLSPAEFGLVALAQVLLRMLLVLNMGGIADFVICDRSEQRDARASSAFWLNVAITTVAVVAGLVATPFVARFYDSPALVPLLVALIAAFAIEQMCVVPDALVKRTLVYHPLIVRDGTLQLIAALGSVAMALLGFGAWSLVIPPLAVAPLRVITVFVMARWRPALHAGVSEWPSILKFSTFVMGSNLVGALANNGDTLIIGKLLGSHALGIYNNAWHAADLLARNTTGVVGKLAIPSLAAVAGDPARLRAAARRMVRVLGLISVPAFTGLFVVADLFVLSVYGPDWTEAIIPLQILIIFAVRRSIGSPLTAVYSALGRPDVGLKMGIAVLPFLLGGIVLGAQYGIIGVALGVMVTRTLYGAFQFKVSANMMGDTVRGLGAPLAGICGASFAMGAIVFGAKLLLRAYLPDLHPVVALAALSALGALVFALLVRLVFHGVRDDILMVAQAISRRLARRITRLLGGRVA